MAILILFGFSLHRLVVCNSQVNFQTQNNRTKFPSNIFDDLFLNIELFPYSATCGSSGSSNIVVNNQEVFCRAELCSIRKYPQSYDNFNIIADVISIGEKECVDPNFNETLRIVKPSNILTRKRNIFQSSGLYDSKTNDPLSGNSNEYNEYEDSYHAFVSAKVFKSPNSCYVKVELEPVQYFDMNSLTYDLWFKVDKNDVIVLKDGQFQAKLRFGEIKIVPLPEDVYPGSRFYFDPNESWTHFALQLVPCRTLSVFINGELQYPVTMLNQNCEPSLARTIYFGDSTSSGKIKAASVYLQVISNREIKAFYSGRLPYYPYLPNCLCGDKWPAEPMNPYFSENTKSMCVSNENFFKQSQDQGISRFPLEQLQDLHIPEMIVDKNLSTYWASEAGVKYASITFEFHRRELVLGFELALNSTPSKFVRVSLHKTTRWVTLQYLSTNCLDILGMDEGVWRYESPEGYGCQRLLRGGRLQKVDFVNLREPNAKEIGSHLAYVINATGIRLDFVGVAYQDGDMQLDKRAQVHLVSDLKIYTGYANPTSMCYSDGIEGRRPINANEKCSCLSSLNKTLAGPFCEPYITLMIPHYGPASGGTLIVIEGALFGDDVKIFFGSFQFFVHESNHTRIVCKTVALNLSDADLLYQPHHLDIILNTGIHLFTEDTFTYRPDPRIDTIGPLRTIIAGGINLTVSGTNIDSVVVPIMTLTYVVDFREIGSVSSVCSVLNHTTMICPTPSLEQFELERRDKRSINIAVSDIKRLRRQVLNTDREKFYIGFILDGLIKYKNASIELGTEQGIINVFRNPEVDRFIDDVVAFRPRENPIIKIKGRRLNQGCSEKDYVISVGAGLCEIVELLTNQITCTPPLTKPELGVFYWQEDPVVKVAVGNLVFEIGSLRYEYSILDNPNFQAALAVTILLILLLLVAAGVLIWYIRRKRRRRYTEKRESSMLMSPVKNSIEKESLMDQLTPNLKTVINDYLIDNGLVKVEKEIGRGHFGKVYKGQYREKIDVDTTTTVAIKTLTGRDVDLKHMLEFLEEATMMCDLRHENVLSLIGIVIDEEDKPMVVLPLMENGDLRGYVANPENNFSIRDLVSFGLHVARGMAYLAAQKFVHRDLAARNCMVSSDRIIKIADFGLARDIYEADYYRVEDKTRPLPIKWMAIEALEELKFTSKSDVWSFGVVLWEIFTRGAKPYSGIENMDMKRYFLMGRRLEKPRFAPQTIYTLMMRCWEYDPDKRPSFDECANAIESYLGLEPSTPEAKLKNYSSHYLELIDDKPNKDYEEKKLLLNNETSSDNNPMLYLNLQDSHSATTNKNSASLDNNQYLNVNIANKGDKEYVNLNSKSQMSTNAGPPIPRPTYNPQVRASMDEDVAVASSYLPMSRADV